MKYRYGKHDIKTLKKERYGSYSFILLICGIGIFAVMLLLILKPSWFQAWVVLSISLSLVLSYAIYHLINRKILLDIKHQDFEIVSTVIINKEIKTDYEAGSGGLIRKMRPFEKYMLYLANNKSINLEKPVFDKFKIGDKIDILYSKNAKILLRIEKVREY